MARVLLIDACVQGFSLGIADSGHLKDCVWNVRFENLTHQLSQLEPFEKILVNHGPGSFTGIRSSLSFVSAMSYVCYPAASISVFSEFGKDFCSSDVSLAPKILVQPESRSRAAIYGSHGLKDFLLERDLESLDPTARVTLTRSWPELESRLTPWEVWQDWPRRAFEWMAVRSGDLNYELNAQLSPLYLRASSAEENKVWEAPVTTTMD